MIDKQTIDLRGHMEPIQVSAGDSHYCFKLVEGDKELEILISFDDYFKKHDECCELVGESTNAELEKKIIEQANKIEEQEEKIELQAQVIESLSERR